MSGGDELSDAMDVSNDYRQRSFFFSSFLFFLLLLSTAGCFLFGAKTKAIPSPRQDERSSRARGRGVTSTPCRHGNVGYLPRGLYLYGTRCRRRRRPFRRCVSWPPNASSRSVNPPVVALTSCDHFLPRRRCKRLQSFQPTTAIPSVRRPLPLMGLQCSHLWLVPTRHLACINFLNAHKGINVCVQATLVGYVFREKWF